MSCQFMEKVEKLTPNCPACDTWIVWCRNPESPIKDGKITSRNCTRLRCRFYSKEVKP